MNEIYEREPDAEKTRELLESDKVKEEIFDSEFAGVHTEVVFKVPLRYR